MIKRLLKLSKTKSFFLWGPRQVGKSTYLKEVFPQAHTIDLLLSIEFVKYLQRPETLLEELKSFKPGTLIVIDEVQKLPSILDHVHWLIENKNLVFGLCGSSARKLKRGHANLLGGRALKYELGGFVSVELGNQFDLVRALNLGYLPPHYLSVDQPWAQLRAYVADYLKEEIAAEGLTRNLPSFGRFLENAALSDTEILNFSSFARDVGVSSHTIQSYFEILQDTLLGNFLPSYTKRPKRKVSQAPKFYFSDVGVVNFLAKRKDLEPRTPLFGKAFENWVFHELRLYGLYSEKYFELSYWGGSAEVDFIVDDMRVAIEAKATEFVHADHLKGLRKLADVHKKISRKLVVSLDSKSRRTEDDIEILNYKDFGAKLWTGELL